MEPSANTEGYAEERSAIEPVVLAAVADGDPERVAAWSPILVEECGKTGE